MEEKWQGNGVFSGIACCSRKLGLAQRAQPARKIGEEREANLSGSGVLSLVDMWGETEGEWRSAWNSRLL